MPLRVIVAAILLMASAGLAWLAITALNPAATLAMEAQTLNVRVLVAAQPLQTGVLLKDSDLRERDLLADQVPDGAILAAVLSPGARAVSIGVDARSGASGLISPGDIVDVILTQEFQRGDTPAGRRVVAETVLTAIRVIAVDQQIAQGAAAPVADTPGSATRVARTITLQVTSEQSERVAVAERLGHLMLAVRSVETQEGEARVAATPREPRPDGLPTPGRASSAVIFGSDVSSALAREEPSAMPRMQVIQGTTRSEVVFR
jgi:pilus assembly protein CpaB